MPLFTSTATDASFDLKAIAGSFPSGVAAIAMRSFDGARHGVTLNAAISLSLDRLLDLNCLGKQSVIRVDLPRPRNLKMLSTSRFAEIRSQIFEDSLEKANELFSEGMADAAELVEAFGQATRGRS